MSQIQDLLLQLGNETAEKIKANIPKATGKTAAAIRVESDAVSVSIFGPDYVYALEYGRGPTKSTTKSNPTLLEQIKEWAMAKSIISDDSKASLSIVYAITKSIHKRGTLLYQSGQPSGVISSVINNISQNSIMREIVLLQLGEYTQSIREAVGGKNSEAPVLFI